jgi:PKD repeat protein
VRQEHWHGDREFIFEIVHDNVWSVEWEFGDGDTSTQHYVRHTYAEAGTYDLTVTVVIDGEEFVYTDTVQVEDPQPSEDGPPAEEVFEIRQEPWLDDREFIFEIVHDNVWSADWEFGDGSSDSGHYVTHTYDADGTYDVTLVVVIDGEEFVYSETLDVPG